MTLPMLILRYALFAAVATVANLGLQRVVLQLGEQAQAARTPVFMAAVFLGTLAGLVLKYVLDKRWIFFDTSGGMMQHGAKFGLYTAMGLITTAIFWGAESLFWFVWHTEAMRELGAVLGLVVGYVIKYRLDRRFVFTDAVLSRSVPR